MALIGITVVVGALRGCPFSAEHSLGEELGITRAGTGIDGRLAKGSGSRRLERYRVMSQSRKPYIAESAQRKHWRLVNKEANF